MMKKILILLLFLMALPLFSEDKKEDYQAFNNKIVSIRYTFGSGQTSGFMVNGKVIAVLDSGLLIEKLNPKKRVTVLYRYEYIVFVSLQEDQ